MLTSVWGWVYSWLWLANVFVLGRNSVRRSIPSFVPKRSAGMIFRSLSCRRCLCSSNSKHCGWPPQIDMITTWQDPKSLTNIPEVMSCLSLLRYDEADLSTSLTDLLSAQAPLVASLSRLQALEPCLDELHLGASLLSHKVSFTAQTAQCIGGRIWSLDKEMSWVQEAGERVEQVMELKVSTEWWWSMPVFICSLPSLLWSPCSQPLDIKTGILPLNIAPERCPYCKGNLTDLRRIST
jgi:hypothetical protein